MSKVVYKYELKAPAEDSEKWDTEVLLPMNSKVLTAGVQNSKDYIWCLVDKNVISKQVYKFHIVPTGFQEVPKNCSYISTLFFKDAQYVFHVFMENFWILE